MYGVYEYHSSVHVIKVDEMHRHKLNADCICGAKYEDGVYVHTDIGLLS